MEPVMVCAFRRTAENTRSSATFDLFMARIPSYLRDFSGASDRHRPPAEAKHQRRTRRITNRCDNYTPGGAVYMSKALQNVPAFTGGVRLYVSGRRCLATWAQQSRGSPAARHSCRSCLRSLTHISVLQ